MRLSAPGDEKLAEILAERMPSDPDNARIIAKHLKQSVVRVVQLHDCKASKTKVEKDEIEIVVGELRKFLEAAVDSDGGAQNAILEIK